MVLPGATHAVPDSHASTVGGLGALAFGCGTTELAHILATQVMAHEAAEAHADPARRHARPACHRQGRGAAHHRARSASPARAATWSNMPARRSRAMPIEQRMTLCNLNIEMGGRSGFVAPDDATFQWIAGRPYAPQGAMWDRALAHWRTLATDDDADVRPRASRSIAAALEPQITWGTDPSQVLGISGRVPDPSAAADPSRRAAIESALAYMGLAARHGARRPAGRTACSSAPAPTRGCRTCKPPPTWCAGAVSREGVIAMVVPGSTQR